MIMHRASDDRERRASLVALLDLPDPPELAGRRGHRVTVDGRPDRLETLVIPYLVAATQVKYVDRDSWPVAP